MSEGALVRPKEYNFGRDAVDGEKERTRLRERANSLLSYEPFVDWAGDMMLSVGFFGEGRELTPFQQGQRGRIVQEIERLCEFADDGAGFLARVFKEKVCKKQTRKENT